MRAVLRRPAKFRPTVEDDLGNFVDADDPLTVTLKDIDGSTVTSGTSTRTDLGKYEFAFSRKDLTLPLTAEADGKLDGLDYAVTETVRVVDRHSVPLSTIRRDPTLSDLPPENVLKALQDAEDALEQALRFRVVTTMDRVTIQTSRQQRVLRLPGPNFMQRLTRATWTRIPSGVVTPIDLGTISIRNDALELPTGATWDFLTGGAPTITWLPGKYEFDIVHGLTETPGDIQNAVRTLTRHFATNGVDQRYPDRASKVMSAETEIWFSRIGDGDVFGIPEVDAVIRARRLDIPIADNSTF